MEKKEVFIIVTMSGKAFYHNDHSIIYFNDDYENQIREGAPMFDTIGEAMRVASELNQKLGATTFKVISYSI